MIKVCTRQGDTKYQLLNAVVDNTELIKTGEQEIRENQFAQCLLGASSVEKLINPSSVSRFLDSKYVNP